MNRLMNTPLRLALPVSIALAGAAEAAAQPLEINWFTIDAGGGVSTGGTLTLRGTIGQPDTGVLSGPLSIHAGYWPGAVGSACYPDCDPSTGRGVLDIFDFLCFQNRYDAGDPYACDCDTSSGPAVCDIFDFLCFQNAFAAGCP